MAKSVVDELIAAGKSVATAESCTGGWIAKSLTDISGSSQCFGYGIVTYSNGAKESMLSVKPASLVAHGAVSEAVVLEMAEGALSLSGATFSVAVSGVAGPDGGSDEKPVGTVWLAWSSRTRTGIHSEATLQHFSGDRRAVREQTVMVALQGLLERLRHSG